MRGGLAVDDPVGLADEQGAYVLLNPHPLAQTLPGFALIVCWMILPP